MPWAPGVYSVTTDLDRTLFTSYADAERVAYDDAAAFCASKGQAVRVKNFQLSNSLTTLVAIKKPVPEMAQLVWKR